LTSITVAIAIRSPRYRQRLTSDSTFFIVATEAIGSAQPLGEVSVEAALAAGAGAEACRSCEC
jgi:hypothetical protein